MTINERIKGLRIAHQYTLKEVADRIGVSEGTVQRYESNAIKEIPYKSIVKLAALYNRSPGYIMGWETINPEDVLFMTPTEEEQKLLRAYRLVSEDRREAVRLLLGLRK